MSDEIPRKVFRNQETRSLAGLFGAALAAMGALTVFLPGEQERADSIAFAIVLLVAAAFALWRVMPQGIYVDREGVTVRGAFSSRFLPWAQISRFQLSDGVWGVITLVDLVDGTSVPARALNGGSGVLRSMTKRAQAQVDELNELVVQARGHEPPPPPEKHGPKKPWEYPGFVIAIQGPTVGLIYGLMEPNMRPFMIPYGILSFVGGLIWFWKRKRDERKRPKSG